MSGIMRFAVWTSLVLMMGCQARQSLWMADRLEKEAYTYGAIMAGAPRITPYQDQALEDARGRLRDAVEAMRPEFAKAPEPNAARVGTRNTTVDIQPSLPGVPERTDKATPPDDFTQALTALSQTALEPGRVDLALSRLSTSRFLESQLEDLDLLKTVPVPDGYERFQVSVSITAWTRRPAHAALVYLDIYPFNGDAWCHQMIERLQAVGAEALATQRLPEGFSADTQVTGDELKTWSEAGRRGDDGYARCHLWLRKNGLIPKLVHVESVGDSRYVQDFQAARGGFTAAFPLGALTAGVTASSNMGAKERDIQLTTLSFAAGEARAGWFFMKRDLQTPMRPIERRVKMIIDIPRRLNKIELHVHKSFLGEHDEFLSNFAHQSRQASEARDLLNTIEHQYPGMETDADAPYADETQWQLAKTRLRNLLKQWSERLVIDVPQKKG